MTESNTKGIGNHLSKNGLEYIPEAHCYLKINGKRIDLTSTNSNASIFDNLLNEIEITPIQVIDFKVDYHKKYVKSWCQNHGGLFDEIWGIREQCIKELGKKGL